MVFFNPSSLLLVIATANGERAEKMIKLIFSCDFPHFNRLLLGLDVSLESELSAVSALAALFTFTQAEYNKVGMTLTLPLQ